MKDNDTADVAEDTGMGFDPAILAKMLLDQGTGRSPILLDRFVNWDNVEKITSCAFEAGGAKEFEKAKEAGFTVAYVLLDQNSLGSTVRLLMVKLKGAKPLEEEV